MAILYLLGCATVFGAFIWATKGHFVQGTKTIPTYLIYLFSVATFVCGVVALFLQPPSVWRMGLGTLVSLLGAALFFWTVHTDPTHAASTWPTPERNRGHWSIGVHMPSFATRSIWPISSFGWAWL